MQIASNILVSSRLATTGEHSLIITAREANVVVPLFYAPDVALSIQQFGQKAELNHESKTKRYLLSEYLSAGSGLSPFCPDIYYGSDFIGLCFNP